MRPRAVILGCAGERLTADERDFLRQADPAGFILFARNCVDPAQVTALVADLRAAVDRPNAPVLIDQEGGRVARLRPPHWRAAPPAGAFWALADRDPEAAAEAAFLNARLLADELHPLGITVNCLPVLDLPQDDADPIIGDRAAGRTPAMAARLGRAVCDGLLAGGVLPVVKHVPGHGRALVDSHRALPVVDAPSADLEAWDLAPFRDLADMPLAMTAHVVYRAWDPARPATTSRDVIDLIIRGHLGFDGLLLSDDLSMKALDGDLKDRTAACLSAGCDIALHCNGDRAEMDAVVAGAGRLSDAALMRLDRALARLAPPRELDRDAALARLSALLEA
ncbi:MAG: beta-N-acetylhexosaminidase [Rhodobacterales bacterium]|nr:beta-N-acetylhexosaminidase [Rhodobacterales bacterium]